MITSLEQSARRLSVEANGESHGARGAGEFRCVASRYLQIDDGAALRAALVKHLLQDWIERLRQRRQPRDLLLFYRNGLLTMFLLLSLRRTCKNSSRHCEAD
jgi:hypothetical protein